MESEERQWLPLRLQAARPPWSMARGLGQGSCQTESSDGGSVAQPACEDQSCVPRGKVCHSMLPSAAS